MAKHQIGHATRRVDRQLRGIFGGANLGLPMNFSGEPEGRPYNDEEIPFVIRLHYEWGRSFTVRGYLWDACDAGTGVC
ncbi:MAG: hypothetical protein ABIJ46_01495, partial [bacterium]